eukprot:14641673-Alexandrium_andersonii.AAC.1
MSGQSGSFAFAGLVVSPWWRGPWHRNHSSYLRNAALVLSKQNCTGRWPITHWRATSSKDGWCGVVWCMV